MEGSWVPHPWISRLKLIQCLATPKSDVPESVDKQSQKTKGGSHTPRVRRGQAGDGSTPTYSTRSRKGRQPVQYPAPIILQTPHPDRGLPSVQVKQLLSLSLGPNAHKSGRDSCSRNPAWPGMLQLCSLSCKYDRNGCCNPFASREAVPCLVLIEPDHSFLP